MPTPASASSVALSPIVSPSTDLGGLAAFGKVALALGLILAIIIACMWLLRRFNPTRGVAGKSLRIIATKAVGTRERVVVLEVEDTWLVLGVTSSQISKLHELPAGTMPSHAPPATTGETFGKRFAAALKQNLRKEGR